MTVMVSRVGGLLVAHVGVVVDGAEERRRERLGARAGVGRGGSDLV